MEKWTAKWKEDELRQLAKQWKDCDECPLSEGRNNTVFGCGNPDAKVMLIGEAPGGDEDSTGTPFIGESGSLLKALLKKAGIDWDDIFVTNIVACRPPKNRDPTTAERDACLSRVHTIIYLIDPWVVVPVGKFALKALAKGRDWAITESHGVVFSSPHPTVKYIGDCNGLEISGRVFPRTGDDKKKHMLEYEMFPILHPAYLLREDGFDIEKKNKFQPGGWTHLTLADLVLLKKYVDALQKEYSKVPQLTGR